ncbi:hypothetical protein HKX48_002799, partial [Thoreauomyces humboldtii]
MARRSVYEDTYMFQAGRARTAKIQPPSTTSAISFGNDPTSTDMRTTTQTAYPPHSNPIPRDPHHPPPPSHNPLPVSDEDNVHLRTRDPYVWDPKAFEDRRRIAKDAAGKVRGSAIFRFNDDEPDWVKGDRDARIVREVRRDAAGVRTATRMAAFG